MKKPNGRKDRRFAGGVFSRRTILAGSAAVFGALPSFAQSTPKLFILPKVATSPLQSLAKNPPKKEVSLAGWFVCNGALASRARERELFLVIGERFGAGDGRDTFALPNSPIEYRNGDPIKGWAICPRSGLGYPAGVTMPFDLDSNI